MEIKDNHTPLQHLAFTPLSHQNEEDQWEHVNSQQTQESAVGHGLIATVENFADDYLRKCDNYRKDLSKKHWEKFKKEMKELSLESDVYSIAAKLLTEVCIAVCNPRMFLFAISIVIVCFLWQCFRQGKIQTSA